MIDAIVNDVKETLPDEYKNGTTVVLDVEEPNDFQRLILFRVYTGGYDIQEVPKVTVPMDILVGSETYPESAKISHHVFSYFNNLKLYGKTYGPVADVNIGGLGKSIKVLKSTPNIPTYAGKESSRHYFELIVNLDYVLMQN